MNMKYNTNILTGTIVLFLTIIAQTANAGTTTLYPIEDTYISSYNPNDNYVSSWSLNVYKSIYPWETNEYITLLKFDFSNIPDLPNGATINFTELRLWSESDNSPTPRIGMYKFSDSSWEQTTVTWNNFPIGTYQLLSDILVPYGGQYYYWNVGPIGNGIITFAVKSTRTTEGSDGAYFDSYNYYNISRRPAIIIDYILRMKGDIDDNGKITSSDALLYLRHVVGQDISPYRMSIADDVTCDGKITAADALKVLRKAVGQDISLECGGGDD